MLQHAMDNEMHAHHMAASEVKPVISQLDVLKAHLSTGRNFVIVFIHGWRHDAEIGDNNVADLRLYAAHEARFIRERCATEPSFCDVKVTAIYVGWRGARVDEQGLKDDFGAAIGGTLGQLSAGATLFDRKPVAEAIAPGAISALRSIETVLAPAGGEPRNRMIVVGHSLGGDMLATGLEDDLVKAVRRHKPGEMLPPVLGDLVVLVNPAAEATKWTTVQREVWARTAFHTGPNTSVEDVVRDNDFFPAKQKARDRLDHPRRSPSRLAGCAPATAPGSGSTSPTGSRRHASTSASGSPPPTRCLIPASTTTGRRTTCSRPSSSISVPPPPISTGSRRISRDASRRARTAWRRAPPASWRSSKPCRSARSPWCSPPSRSR